MDFVNSHHQKAFKLHAEGKFLEAVEEYNQAIEQNPQHPDILADRATSFLLLEKFQLCLIDFNEAAELEPENPYRFASRAFAKARMSDTMGAIVDYERAIELDPEDAISMNNLGLLLENQGNRQQAQNLYSEADKLSANTTKFDYPEPKQESELPPLPEIKKAEPIEETQENFLSIIKSIFTKEGIKDFLRFVFNGFKFKDRD